MGTADVTRAPLEQSLGSLATSVLLVGTTIGIALVCCSSKPQEILAGQTNMTDSDKPLRADCTVETSGEDIRLRFRITNTSNATVHVFASSRMPYLIKQPDGSLLVLRGVNPPDPDVDYAVYEIPTTQPLEPGQSIEGQVVLNPLYLADHYEKQRTPTPLHGPVKVHFSVAWADTPIRTSDRSSMSIQQVIAWQRLIEVAELEVSFP